MYRKNFLVFFIFIPFLLIAQNTVRLEINKNDKIFRITKLDSLYAQSDTVEMKLEVINNSKKEFYILDIEALNPEPTVYEKKGRIYFVVGGTFNAQLNLFHKLKLMKPKEKFEYTFSINLNEINFNLKKDRYNYVFYISLGYFDYSEDFMYLTQSDSDSVPLKSSADCSKLASAHHEVLLGYLPFSVLK